jgi:flavin reductase (DIM6/NTAB) family NADH-FMN oxidoreductase RutF
MDIDISALPTREAHDLLSSAIIPRPIAWVSTVNDRGAVNLAPFSFFTGVTWNPPTLCFSVVNRPDGSRKDTIRNIEETGTFTVNVVSEDLTERMVMTSRTLPPDADEAAEAGIALEPSITVQVPRVSDSKISFECLLDRIVTVGAGPNAGNLVIGSIKRMHVSDELLGPGSVVDWKKLRVVGRLSGSNFCRVRSAFEIHVDNLVVPKKDLGNSEK